MNAHDHIARNLKDSNLNETRVNQKDEEVSINEANVTIETVEMPNEIENKDEAVQQNAGDKKNASEEDKSKEFTNVDSAMLTEPSTSQDNTLPCFDNVGSSSSERNETKECIAKDQIDSSGGVSMESLGNSSDEDSGRQRLSEGVSSSSISEDVSCNLDRVNSTMGFNKIKSWLDDMKQDDDTTSDSSSDDLDAVQLRHMKREQGTGSDGRFRKYLSSNNDFCDIDDDSIANRPKAKWSVVPELTSRERGCNPLFHRRCYGSLHVAERLKIMQELNEHRGCVNGINFNQKGNLLASCSDDLTVIIWNWAVGKKRHVFDTGHTSNVFQSKWLPFDDNFLITCARDGLVRLLDVNRGTSRGVATHDAPAHKLDIQPDSPHIVLSAGEDAKVLSIDIRENEATELTVVKDGIHNVRLYSVQSHPINCNEFCVGGFAPEVRIYDRRKASTQLHKLCPAHLIGSPDNVLVTSAVYNYNGTEILASYSDELIYLFDAVSPKIGDFVHSYDGHTNTITVKGVSFFGPKSEFVVSGCDSKDIFVWDKESEVIINSMSGGKRGVVNCLEPHPHIPVLATCGLRYDVKIWAPSNDHSPTVWEHSSFVMNLRGAKRTIRLGENTLYIEYEDNPVILFVD
ncbi:DDB1- and CUL4-associated factor 8 isoform X3 [Lasioglossum baleicum]|uniref:DDB1- and CUL4-associated factor 8 isoform X3 n=1 Tax=Lasioglossum baleicum TaxID=434251 RepID=UPI003FCC8FF0